MNTFEKLKPQDIKFLKVRVTPLYVSTGTVLDIDGNFVAGTKTKADAEKFVSAVSLYDDLINKFAND